MTPWRWFAGHPGEYNYDIACDCASREEVIRQAMRELRSGDAFQIIEARSSEDIKHEGSDCVPFLRTRNHEILTAGPSLTDNQSQDGAQ